MVLYSILTLVCSILYSISAVLCKYGLQHNINVRSLSFKALMLFLINNKWWIIGVVLAGIANVSIIEIQSRLDVSIVYSLLNFSYIFVLVLGHYFLHEHLDEVQWLGVGVVIIGTATILAVPDPITGMDTDIPNLLILTTIAVLAVFILIATAYQNKQLNYEILYAVCTGICFGCVEIYLKTNTNLVVAETGQFTIFNMESIKHFLTVWPFFVMFCFGAFGWVFLQVTYSHGNVSVTIPTMAVTQRIVSLSGGSFVFGETFSMLRIAGLSAIIFGVLILVVSTINIEEAKTV